MNKKIISTLQLISIYAISIFCATTLFLALFWVDFLSNKDILFFKSIELMLMVCVIMIITIIFLKKNISILKELIFRDIILICLLFFTINNMVYGLIPFNASRSVSVMLVGYLYHQERSISKADLDDYINKKYFIDEDAVGKRLNEQIRIGNVALDNGGYKITKKGAEIVKVMGLITSAYNMDKNFAK